MAESGHVAGDVLRSYIERVERLEADKKAIMEDIKEVFAEAKAVGFEPKIMRQVIRLRKMEKSDREEQDYLLDTYLRAIELEEAPATGPEAAAGAL